MYSQKQLQQIKAYFREKDADNAGYIFLYKNEANDTCVLKFSKVDEVDTEKQLIWRLKTSDIRTCRELYNNSSMSKQIKLNETNMLYDLLQDVA
jgi:hypothetical protein